MNCQCLSFIENKRLVINLFLIIALGFIAYGNSLRGEFIWDDMLLVKENTYIKNPANFVLLFSRDIGEGAESEFGFYRPLQMLSYFFDYKIWGLNTAGFHLTNIILHISVAISLYFLIFLFFKDGFISLLTSLLFMAHPVHTGAVSYISGRADSLASLFMILCLIFYIKYLDSKRLSAYILVIISYSLALLSRENSLIFPAIIILYHCVFRVKINFKVFYTLAITAFAYILLRLTLLRNILLDISTYETTLLQRIPGFFAALTEYLRILILPFNLHTEYGEKIFLVNNPLVLLGALLFLLLLTYALGNKRRNTFVSLSIGWFFIFLSIQSNIYPLSAYMAEHWLYLPSIGFFLIISNIFTRLLRIPRLKRVSFFLLVAILSFYSFLTIKQNSYWQDAIGFYSRTLKYAPQSARMYYNLGLMYYEKGRSDEAVSAYQKAIELNPQYAQAHYNLGITYYYLGKKDQAIVSFKKAIDSKPNYAKAYYNLGNTYSDIGKIPEAIESYKKAIEALPNNAKAYNNLGIVYSDDKQYNQAIEVFKKALNIDAKLFQTHYNLGNAYSSLGRDLEAIASFKKAIEIKPDYTEAYNNLGISYYNMGQLREAIDAYKKTIELNPNYVIAYNNLGNAYKASGQRNLAIDSYKRSIEIDPNYAMAYNNLAVSYYYQGQYDLAVTYADKALELGYPLHPEFLKALAPYRETKDKSVK